MHRFTDSNIFFKKIGETMNMGSYLKVPNGNQGNFSGLHSGFPHGLSAGLGSGLSPMPMPSLGSIGFSQYMDQSSYANGKFVF